VDGRLAVNPLSWLVGLGIEDDLVVGVLTRMDPEAIWAGWGRFVRHGDALDRWPSWVNALPTATGLALCDAALASGHSEFLVQVLASGASEALLSGLLHRDLPADADVEVLVRLLARPDPERLGMAQAYLERNDGQALIFLLRLDARVPASTIDRLEAALASDHELLRRLAEAPAAVLPALVVRARRELERTEGGPILKAAPGHLALRSRLVRELADTGSPRLVPLAAGIEELQGILLEAYVAAGCLAGLQALASQGDDDGVVLQAIAYLGALGDGGTHRWLNDLLSGWFIGRDVRRAAQEALAQVSKRLGAGGVALADAGGELSTPDVP
jgi:hypothetical protein